MKKFGKIMCTATALLMAVVSLAWSADKPEFTMRMQVIHSPAHSDFKLNQQTAEDIFKATQDG